ncbi:hypothetical protein GA0115239_11802 [Streptomyces sp. BpilaLS-43]|uniref:hypothetical protein n=1 Tax=Streptomyces sp. BpilaLS-43 TaxID=1839778 RepID=UPI00081B227F|nr:hypothetical protein [Streptomyces sp. BpilaLS-43]SCE05771.1 hypothetical protein GA0115239_11802 [Streptomyces sp. BpilaLS-43]
MRRTLFGRTGVRVSELAPGAMTLGGHESEPEGAHSLIDNRTDTVVLVYEAPACPGNLLGGISPGSQATAAGGTGVFVEQSARRGGGSRGGDARHPERVQHVPFPCR